jgi:citrate synthase
VSVTRPGAGTVADIMSSPVVTASLDETVAGPSALDGERVEFAKEIEGKAVDVLRELKPGRELYPNVEFYAGIVMDLIGMPRELFTPTFACSRVVRWCAHVMEQAADNRLIRPSARYVGPEPPQPVPG